MSNERITSSSGNVFADIGFPDAEELSLKAQLVANLGRLMKLHKLTQKYVAERVGADQPTISKILRGHLNLITVDRLLQWHACLGQEVQISIRDRSAGGMSPTSDEHVSVFTCSCPT